MLLIICYICDILSVNGGKDLNMSINDQVLELLEKNRDGYISGAGIAKQLGVSRTAVWKAVNYLKSNGYIIDAVTNKGYRISNDNDILSAAGIKKHLKGPAKDIHIHTFDKVTSTNSVLREMADNGAPHGTAIAAASQTTGRGRLGRCFFSPPDTGIYVSLLLRPNTDINKAILITTAAAVSVCDAIEALTDKKPMIKWVNDIFIGDKKICGILTEASLGIENGNIEYAVLGIGINVYAPENGYPKELSKIAGNIFDSRHSEMRNRLCAEVLNSFMKRYNDLGSDKTYEDYKRHSLVTGRKISVISAKESVPGTAVDIDRNYRLIVRFDDGSEKALSSGEISIRI